MKKVVFLLLSYMFILCNTSHAQIKIPADSIGYFIGKEVEITDTISQIKVNRKAFYLNFGGKYPNVDFSAVIFEVDNDTFPERLKWKEGNVATITGIVTLLSDKPKIVLTEEKQIKVIQ